MRKILNLNELGEFSGEREEYLFKMIESEKIASLLLLTDFRM